MRFETGERLLAQNFHAVIAGIVGKQVHVGVTVEDPLLIGPERMRDPKLWLERPTVGTEVQYAIGIIFSGRRSDRQRDADTCRWFVLLEGRDVGRRPSKQ